MKNIFIILIIALASIGFYYYQHEKIVVVSGEYSYNQFTGAYPSLDFFVDDQTKSAIPRSSSDKRNAWFHINNETEALDLLDIDEVRLGNDVCEIKGRATIEITDYSVYKGESEGSDGANLLKVLDKSEPIYAPCAR